MKTYTSSDIQRTLSVSQRTARRLISEHVEKKGNEWKISEQLYNTIIDNYNESSDIQRTYNGHTTDKNGQERTDELITQEFNQEEYDLLQEIIHKYPVLKDQLDFSNNQIKYLQEALKQQQDMHEKLIITIQSRNLIDYEKKTENSNRNNSRDMDNLGNIDVTSD